MAHKLCQQLCEQLDNVALKWPSLLTSLLIDPAAALLPSQDPGERSTEQRRHHVADQQAIVEKNSLRDWRKKSLKIYNFWRQ